MQRQTICRAEGKLGQGIIKIVFWYEEGGGRGMKPICSLEKLCVLIEQWEFFTNYIFLVSEYAG